MNYLNYQFSLFGSFAVNITVDESMKIQKELNETIKGVSFYQTIVTNYNVDIANNIVKQTKDFSYFSDDNKINIAFSPSRIDFNFSNSSIHDYQNYIKLVGKVFELINGTPNRLALNTISISNYYSSENDYDMLLNFALPIKYYEEFSDGLDEWSVSYNKTKKILINSEELINVITHLSKTIRVENPNERAIMWKTDINTDANNLIPRFTYDDFIKFLHNAIEIHNEIVNSNEKNQIEN